MKIIIQIIIIVLTIGTSKSQTFIYWDDDVITFPSIMHNEVWRLEHYEKYLEHGFRVTDYQVLGSDTLENSGFSVKQFNDSLVSIRRTHQGKPRGGKILMGKHPEYGFYVKHNRLTKKRIWHKSRPIETTLVSDTIYEDIPDGYILEIKTSDISEGSKCVISVSKEEFLNDGRLVSQMRASKAIFGECLDSNWMDSKYVSSIFYKYRNKNDYIVENEYYPFKQSDKLRFETKIELEYVKGKRKSLTTINMLTSQVTKTMYYYKGNQLIREEIYYDGNLHSITELTLFDKD